MVAFYVTLVFAAYVAVAYLGAHVAHRKGRPFGLYFAAGLLIGPIVLLGALLLPIPRRPV
jgi:hypothetical protein